MIATIVTDRRIDRVFDYLIPDFLEGKVSIGHRVRIPLGTRQCTGYVISLKNHSDSGFTLKPITALCDEQALLTPQLVQLAAWIAEYYITPIESVITSMLPPLIRRSHKPERSLLHVSAIPNWTGDGKKITPTQEKLLTLLKVNSPISVSELISQHNISRAVVTSLHKRGAVTLSEEKMERHISRPDILPSQEHTLNDEQVSVLTEIFVALQSNQPAPILLHGVTGSGKTEIYLQAIAKNLVSNRTSLILVPEIALTPQTIERFCSRFEHVGEKVAILHSHLSDGERAEQWLSIRRNQSRIVIGTRSAIFSPLENLGLIIIDEEHDTSYKQSDAPRYHARDVAVMRGRLESALVILGSATPSLESCINADSQRYRRLRLTSRVDSQVLPTIHLVDMRREKRTHGPPILSKRLADAIHKRLELGEQTILFLNRRGYSPSVTCASCGHVIMCPHCSVPIVFHKQRNKLLCHLCGHQESPPEKCSACGSDDLLYGGFGTERVEYVLRSFFPKAAIRRVDSDTLKGKDAHLKMFQDFRRGEIDILLGTQMIAKGLHFPNVTLVGVIHADTALNLPDFRASERVFQLITQVAGRAGRGDVAGEVIVQTYLPFHTAIQSARHYDWETFYVAECEFRKSLGYPPFRRCILITIRSKDEAAVIRQSTALFESLRAILPKNTEIGQPTPAPIAKLKDHYRHQIFLKYPRNLKIQKHLRPIIMNFARQRDTSLQCDVDPVFLL